jgi:glycosyltransferase involved in cell wall biosynthesis
VANYTLLSILIPVFNEERCLPELLRRLEAVAFPIPVEVVLADDGSTDGTGDILASLAGHPRYQVLRLGDNRGKAAAIQRAIEHARGDLYVIQDADLEYDPAQLPSLLAPILQGDADIVYGSRFLGQLEGMKPLHVWGNRFLTWVTNRLYRTRLTDMETCYKLAPAAFYRQIEITSRRFELEPEITAKLLRQGHRIREVPILFQGRGRGEGKKISWTDGFGAVRVLWRYRNWQPGAAFPHPSPVPELQNPSP